MAVVKDLPHKGTASGQLHPSHAGPTAVFPRQGEGHRGGIHTYRTRAKVYFIKAHGSRKVPDHTNLAFEVLRLCFC